MPSMTCSLPAFVESAVCARIASADFLRAARHPPDDDIQIVVSELVTNAVCHASTPLEFAMTVEPGHVHIEVSDGDPSPPVRRPAAGDRIGGHGLNLVAALSAQWGVSDRRDHAPGKTVWADFAS